MTRSTSSPRGRRLLATSTVAALLAGSVLATALPASAADDPIDGPRTSGDAMFPNVGNGGYDALDYDIDLTWNATGVVNNYMTGTIPQATTTMTARAATPLRSFSLDFEGMTVDSVLVNGAPATWTRDIDADAIKYKLIVTPATPVSGEFTVTVNYSGTPSRHVDADGSYEGWNPTADGAVLLGQPIGMMTGFPHNNTPSDKATYTITVDAPSTITSATGTGPAAVASNGELQSKTEFGDRTTWTWRQSRPMASELAIIDIGKFDVIEGSVTLTDGRVIPSWSFMDSALSAQDKTTITNRVAQLEAITRNLESLFGPYPGGSTGVVVDTVPSGVSYALETQDRSFFPSTRSVSGNTLIHELVHQWYGNNVAPTTWTDIWMGEGMATWAPTFYNSTEGFGTGASAEQSYYTSWNGKAAESGDWSIAPGGQTDSAELYSYQTYTRGAQFWAALKVAIGDEAFFTLIKQWQIDNTGQSRSGAQLKALAEELSGIDLTSFWTDWILEPGKPAWPDKLSVALTGGSETALLPGDSVSYTVSATNTGRVALASSVVEIDLTGLLANAELDALPEGATLDGTTLRWQVPAGTAVETTVELTFTATILESSPGGSFATTGRVVTVGGTCADCSVDTLIVEKLAPSELPVITGDAVVGESLTASSAGWPEDTELTYEWVIDGIPVETEEPVTEPTVPALRAAALAANEFLIPAEAEGSRITVTVTGTLEGFRDGSATSAPTDVVRAAEVPVDSDADADGTADAGGADGSADAGGTSGADGGSAAGGSSTAGTGTGSSPTGEQLSETGAELPIAAGLLALILLTAGGMFAAARRRSRIEA